MALPAPQPVPEFDALISILLDAEEYTFTTLANAARSPLTRRQAHAQWIGLRDELLKRHAYFVARLPRVVTAEVRQALRDADRRLAAMGIHAEETTAPVLHVAEVIIADLVTHQAAALRYILRQTDDYLRDVAGHEIGISGVLGEGGIAGGRRLREAMIQDIRDAYPAARRIRQAMGVPYRNGRVVSLSTYSTMAVRTGLARGYTEAAIARYRQHNVPLVKISEHGTLCSLCYYLEGKVFALSPHPDYPLFTGQVPTHPNCAHVVAPFYPTDDDPGTPPDNDVLTADSTELDARFREEQPTLAAAARRGFTFEHEVRDALRRHGGTWNNSMKGPHYTAPGIELIRRRATALRVLDPALTERQAMHRARRLTR